MKIYTKTGDNGETSLIGGKRVSKANRRIDAYGTIDELNSYLGLLKDQAINQNRTEILKEIQDRLFTIGASLAAGRENPAMQIPDLYTRDVEFLEQKIDEIQDTLEPMRNFILPGGHQSISFGHVARCVCRRAERLCIILHEEEPIEILIIQYLNRLSDYLFILCRKMHQELNVGETPWKPRK